MKNILVTGGAGYIGSHVVNLLIERDYNVTVIDNLVTGNLKLINKNAQFYNIDVGDEKNVNKILKQNHWLKFNLI